MLRSAHWLQLGILAAALAGAGCSGDDAAGPGTDGGGAGMDGSGGGGDGGGGGADSGGGGAMDGGGGGGGDSGGPIVEADGGTTIVEDGGATWVCHITTCAGHLLDCGNCIDDDGDGLVDSHDPECLGPCDNTETPGLLADVGGESGGPCGADCYFDFGNGSGGDDCIWDHRCDPLSIAPSYDPEGPGCAFDATRVGSRTCPDVQPSNCAPHCGPLTPNGCDCFGCCTFDALTGRSASEGGEYIWIGSVFEGTNTSSCTLADIADRTLCRPCTPVAECLNTCGPCELCIGRTMLPPECTTSRPDGGIPDGDGGLLPYDGGPSPWDGGTPPPRCDPGITPCGLPGDAPCPASYYCVTGCCQAVII